MRKKRHATNLLCFCILSSACATAPKHRPNPLPPSPASISYNEPGGDAEDPHRAALQRLLDEPIGFKVDKFNTLRVSLFDWRNWRRIRVFTKPTRAAFRYGKKHHAIIVILYEKSRPDDTPAQCLERVFRRSTPMAEKFAFELAGAQREHGQHLRGVERRAFPSASTERRARYATMPIIRTGGRFVTLFNQDHYLAAATAYKSWPGTCLIQGFAVRVDEDEDLAQAVLDRWLDQVAGRLSWSPRLRHTPPFKNR